MTGTSTLKMLSTGRPTSNRAASRAAAGNTTRKPTGIRFTAGRFTRTTARLGANQRPTDVQPHVLRGSREPNGGRCVWWVQPGSGLWSLPVSRCESVWGLGYGKRLRPAYEECVRGSELRQGVVSFVFDVCSTERIYLYLIDLSPPRPRASSSIAHGSRHTSAHVVLVVKQDPT